MAELVLYLLLILVASFVVWKGGSMLESASETLATHYQLPPVVQGSIITAIGSSFPELSTTIISTLLHGEFDLGVSAIVGSAIFNILVIPGLSSVIAGKMNTQWMFVVKDIQFYIISIMGLMLIFGLAVIYNPVAGSDLRGIITRELALIPIFLYVLYLVLQQEETRAYRRDANNDDHPRSNNIGKVWLRFGVSLILIVGSVEALVRAVLFLGEYFQTPSFVWGATVLAAATSVPDAIVSVKGAMNRNGVTSMANVIGSNIFDLLIAVPAGILIAGNSIINFSVASPLMLFLGLSTVLLIMLLLRSHSLNRSKGTVLLFTYLFFVIWVIMESNGMTSFIGTPASG